jgi:L-iditol 2-dehydrogenase
VFAVPEPVDIVEAPLLEPLCIGVHAVELARDLRDAVVVVVGCGAVGLFTLQMARLRGARTIVATDPVPDRLAVAQELGANGTIRVGPQDPVEEVLRATEGRGVDVAFEAAGPPEATQQCLDVLRPAGQLVVIGIPSEDEYRFRASQLRRHEVTVQLVRRQNENYPEAIELVRQGAVKLSPVLTHRFPMERAQEAFELAHRKGDGAVRVAVTFG